MWHGRKSILGVERLPRNLIIGVRSACAAAAEARSTLVANIFTVGWLNEGEPECEAEDFQVCEPARGVELLWR